MKTSHKIMAAVLCSGLLFWAVDAGLESRIYRTSFLDQLLFDVPPHAWTMRTVVWALLATFGLVASSVLAGQRLERRHIAHLNAVLRAIRNVNQLIAVETDRTKLLEGVGERLIETRGYASAWVALFHEDGTFETGFGAGLGADFAPFREMLQRGDVTECMQEVLAKRGIVVRKDVAKTCADCPLHGLCAGSAGMAARLEHAGRVYGMLTVSLPAELADAAQDQALIQEVADDIALALHAIEAEETRKQAEAALRERTETLNAVFDASPVGIGQVRDRVLGWGNARLYQMVGYEEGTLLGEPASVLYETEEEYDRVGRELYWQLDETGSGQVDTRWVRKDGTVFDCHLEVRHFSASDPSQGQVVAVMDITERVQAEAALRESEERFREMADLLPDMLYESDADLNITYANQVAFTLLGYTREDIEAGINILHLLSPHDFERGEGRLQEVARTNAASTGEYSLRAKNGSFVPCEINSAPIAGSDGALLGFRGVIRDITDRKRAEAAQRLATVGELAAGTAHEFNNVLAAMSLEAQLAEGTRDQSNYDRLVETVLKGTRRGARICADLTRFSRPAEPERQPVFVENIVELALSMASPQLTQSDVTIERDYRTQGKQVYVDADQVQQVFLNLFINAAHAMQPQGGVLTLSTQCVLDEDAGEWVDVTVSDTGCGIAADNLSRIFEPFFTTKGALGRSDIPGTGLGLSVSHSMVVSNGGTIEVESEQGVGTTFHVRLPACQVAAVKEEHDDERSSEPAPRHEGRGGRILLAEDEDAIRESIVDGLTTRGHEVLTAVNASEAVSVLASGAIDLVITDLLMPGGGGRAVATAAGKLDDPPPLLVITGKSALGLADELREMGAARCLAKPFLLPDLLSTVGELLAARDRHSSA